MKCVYLLLCTVSYLVVVNSMKKMDTDNGGDWAETAEKRVDGTGDWSQEDHLEKILEENLDKDCPHCMEKFEFLQDVTEAELRTILKTVHKRIRPTVVLYWMNGMKWFFCD